MANTFLVEIAAEDRASSEQLLPRVREVLQGRQVREVETAFAQALGRLYVVVEADSADIAGALASAGLPVVDSAQVRVVGTPADASRTAPSHLVEWDLPKNLAMDQYLKRKAEKTPLYANAPDVQFLRTYVREDMVKCVCLYDAPDEAAVRHAREVVSAPVDRLSPLATDQDGRRDGR